MPERILGYTDKVSVAPGDTIAFKVSSPAKGHYQARILRLICGDDQPAGPGFKAEPVTTPADGTYRARHQPIRPGSYAVVASADPFRLGSFTLQAMIWPTLPGNGKAQAILGTWDAATESGYALYLDETGALALRCGSAILSTGQALLPHHWYQVQGSYDATTGRLQVVQQPLITYARQDSIVEAMSTARDPGSGGRFLIAAWNDGKEAIAHFNGKIDSPRVSSRALTLDEVDRLRGLPLDSELTSSLVAAWDFSRQIGSIKVQDISGNRRHGKLVNLPARAMTGWNWDASEMNWTRKTAHYGAIHFHDDDLYDCGWKTDFTLTVPEGLRSGIYCAHLVQGDLEEFLPFFVRPRPGTATAKLALLIPTASYWAYANHQMPTSWDFYELSSSQFLTFGAIDRYLEEHVGFGLSTYDHHNDGSGVCYASRLRPLLHMRPKSDLWQFNADTHITDWLEAKGLDYDVITDDDLHREGVELLRPYRCVLTGTHPEYYSMEMLDAVQAYTETGGRLAYLGANGFYWRIAYHPTLPGVIEHRRAEDGMRAWIAEGGEYYMSFTGELSGLWRRMGRPPQALVGTGFTAQGFDIASHYQRTPESNDPRAAFIFSGIGADERIGDFGLIGGGAAGWEVDRADPRLGTPPHALTVAVAQDFPASYHWVKEEFNHSHAAITGETCPLVRCDMVFFETPKGGAVFSTSSISWSGALSHNGYDNNVSRITENVVRRFLDPAPL